MEVLRWITTLAAFSVVCLALPSRIHVGGLFDAEDEEIELSFKIAVDWLNSDEILLKNSRIIASVERLYDQDSFKVNKLSCGLLQNGVAALFGPQSPLTSMHVQSICDDLEVPHINSRWEYRLSRDKLNINLYPTPTVLNTAFLRLLEIWDWKEFFYVYEEDEATIRLEDFLAEGGKKNWTIKLYQFPNDTSYRNIFWQIKKSTMKGKLTSVTDFHIVLDVPRNHLYKVLKAAQQVGMMTENQKYLITSLDVHTVNLEDFQYGKTNITALRLVQEDTEEFQNLLKEVNNRLSRRKNSTALSTLKTESALIYDSVRLLAHALENMDTTKNVAAFPPISCNLMNKGIDGTSLTNIMRNVKGSGLSGLLEFDYAGFRSRIHLDVMYLTAHGLKKIGTITPGTHGQLEVKITSPGSSEFQYMELEHSHFRVTTIMNEPYAMLRESSQLMLGNERFEGYVLDVLEALAESLHFTYDVHEVKDKSYGSLNETTNEFNGMIQEVIIGDADLAIADLTINQDRLKGVDFTLPFMQTGISILFKKPTQRVTSLFSFLLPFSGEVWILIIASYCFISILLFIVGRMSPYEWSNPYPCREKDLVEYNCFSLLNSMWWSIGSLLQQGSDVSPTAPSTRALTNIWSFFRLIMISSYTANLAAFLTVEKLVSPFESAEDLAKQEKIKYGCVESGSTRGFFKRSELGVYQTMYKFMEKHADQSYVDSNAKGIAKVKEGNYAFLMEATSIEYISERECNLTQIGGLLDSKGYGIAVKKNNHQLRNWLSRGVLDLQEKGTLHKLKEKWWKQKRGGGKCSAAKSSGSVNELGLGNVGGVILVMVLGLCLSAVVGVVEFFWFQRKIRRDARRSVCKLFAQEIKYAITCGSSTKPAPKLKDKEEDTDIVKVTDKSGYRLFS